MLMTRGALLGNTLNKQYERMGGCQLFRKKCYITLEFSTRTTFRAQYLEVIVEGATLVELGDQPHLHAQVVIPSLGAEEPQYVIARRHLRQLIYIAFGRPRLLVLQREYLHGDDPAHHLRSPHAPVAPPGLHLEKLERAESAVRRRRGYGRRIAGRELVVVRHLVPLPNPDRDGDEQEDGEDRDEGVRQRVQDVTLRVVRHRCRDDVYNRIRVSG